MLCSTATCTCTCTSILGALVAVVAIAYVFFTWSFDYWKKRGVPYIKPLPLVGNFGAAIVGKRPVWALLDPFYDQLKGNRFGGIFQSKKPILLVCDPDLIKQVLTKDFSSFHDRGQPFDAESDPLSANLFNLEGMQWKNLRAKLSPTFTSGKIKLMFPLITDIADEMKSLMKSKIETNKELEMKDILTRFATDVIGSCAFGIQCNSLKDPESEFYLMGRDVFKKNLLFLIRFLLETIHPFFSKLLPLKLLFSKQNTFFIGLMSKTVEFREKNDIVRNDFVHLMMQLRESSRTETDFTNHIEFTHGVMTAQAFLFFVAGLHNVAYTVGYCLHELAKNPNLQKQAVREVREVMEKHDGKMSYEAVQQMHLIDRIVCEGLRKYVPVAILARKVTTSSYKIPGTDISLDDKAAVFIPVRQLHHDPKVYPDPNRFDPDRFTDEAKQQRHPYTYLPFGEGPRVCIAQRFAMLEMKICLASLLEAFTFSFGPMTDVNLELDRSSVTLMPKKGFWLSIQERPSGLVPQV